MKWSVKLCLLSWLLMKVDEHNDTYSKEEVEGHEKLQSSIA